MRNILKNARLAADMTQQAIAQKLGITVRYYVYIESGSREGKGSLWDQLEVLFNTPQRQLRENFIDQ